MILLELYIIKMKLVWLIFEIDNQVISSKIVFRDRGIALLFLSFLFYFFQICWASHGLI